MLPSIRPKQGPVDGVQAPPHPAANRRRQSAQAKRKTVVAVACQPCQRRKHKCDGERPTCTPCLARNRSDCAYDAEGDQRRTSALKGRIETLSRQVDDLKDIVTAIAVDPAPQRACETARQLAADGFLNTAQAAHALRAQLRTSFPRRPKTPPPQAEHKHGLFASDPPSSSLPFTTTPETADWHSQAPWLLERRIDLHLYQPDYGDIPIDVSASPSHVQECVWRAE
ncbi:fungal specific transcription factor domain-containing protein [Diplodia corticola]|uniref:Fungal specific transcription factor domain-containing protein n=1 Tax=Diplodia corticola TaxID=236234 RepID=A0A1J9R778_9PEZI|nr:fungal specific transcription factor domain-containing protein [Diplodia corticola]OJD37374.1 fungal specific transcription factor domain-containing protein [Diplodia corticola]